MDKKPKLRYPVVVEGKYDRIKIDSLFDARVLTTNGFSLYRDNEKKALLKRLAAKTPLIFLTDSDNAGRQIRSLVHNLLPKDRQIHLYIPQIPGKEKRKTAPSAEGFLGVEGCDPSLLRELLAPFTLPDPPPASDPLAPASTPPDPPLTKTELYLRGYVGATDSAAKRNDLLVRCGLPKNLSTAALLDALNLLYSHEEIEKLL